MDRIVPSRRRQVVCLILICLGTLVVLYPSSPANARLSQTDSGVFLYMGSRILSGAVPYRDVWDHKPPVIFYIDALGLGIANGSVWGVWLIEVAAVGAAAILAFLLLRSMFGDLVGILAVFLFLLSLVPVLDAGNLTEEYALPLQFACFYLFYRAEKRKQYGISGFVLGVLLGILFMTKQTTIGVGIAIGIYLLSTRLYRRQYRQLVSEGALLLLGVFVVSAVVSGYFVIQHAFTEFWQAAFLYNLAYSARDSVIGSASQVSSELVRLLSMTGLLEFGLVGAVLALILLRWRRPPPTDAVVAVLAVALIDLPIEFLLVNASGKIFGHYLMTLLPVLVILTGYAGYVLNQRIAHTGNLFISKQSRLIRVLIIPGLLVLAEFNAFQYYWTNATALGGFERNSAIEYITHNTTRQDFVLMIGAEARMNFFSQRVSPSKYVYQYPPLYTPGYTNSALVEGFLGDIEKNRPKLIIDTFNRGLDGHGYSSAKINEELQFIKSHYVADPELLDGWTVYQYVQN